MVQSYDIFIIFASKNKKRWFQDTYCYYFHFLLCKPLPNKPLMRKKMKMQLTK